MRPLRETLYTGSATYKLSDNKKYYEANILSESENVVLPTYYKARGDAEYFPVLEAFFTGDKITKAELSPKTEKAKFSGCFSLTEIFAPESNGFYKSTDGILFNKNGTKLVDYPQGKKDTKYSVPNTVTEIGESAFFDCNSLTAISNPDGVTEIKDFTFNDCDLLKTVEFSENSNLKRLGDSAFFGCSTALITFVIPSSVEEIDTFAFPAVRE